MVQGQEGDGKVNEFNRPSGLCCDDRGQVIIADSKNQRLLVYNTDLEFLWMVSRSFRVDQNTTVFIIIAVNNRIIIIL